MRKILILAANPKDTSRLRLDEEVRDISEGLERAKRRDAFAIAQRWAVRPRDFQRAMLDETPQIVHFSGHGEDEAGIYLEGATGTAQLVTGEALASLFALFSNSLECVVLNGCYSEAQAQEIAAHVPYVIGMSQAVKDRSAIEFAVGFYDALGAGQAVERAFQFGCVAMNIAGTGEQTKPVLLRGRAEDISTEPSATTSEVKETSKMSQLPASPADQPLNVFISYSHKDENLKEELELHLSALKRQGKIKPWQDRAIEAGTEWDAEIKAQLEAAQIILLLVTPRFMASEYIHDQELTRAMERHEAGTARVIPIILKPVDFKGTPFEKLQALPKDAKPVTRWDDQDEAFLNVVQGIRRVVASLFEGSAADP
ncbi:MAG: TIR domain-containing protein [Cyanobacteria bacterium P01_A01_bin.114]